MLNTSLINKSILSFKKIPIEKINNINLSPEYKFVTKDYYDYFVRSDFNSCDNKLFTSIDNENDFDIAHNQAKVDLPNKTLYAKTMCIFNTSKRRQGLGIVLHLNNVINMLENNLDNIKLFSLGTAVLFHSKCKFEPDITDSTTLMEVLCEISDKDVSNFPEIKDVAQRADDFVLIAGYKNGIKDYQKFLQEGNEIVSEYLNIVSSKKLNYFDSYEYGFFKGMNMVLTKEKVMENKDFYNKLFKKYNIDYEIKDPQ